MVRSSFILVGSLLGILGAGIVMPSPAWSQGAKKVIWIYKGTDQSKAEAASAEKIFAPFGYMPGDRADSISVNASKPVDGSDPSKGNCIDYLFKFDQLDQWAGSYHLIGGNSWGKKPGIDLQKVLKLKPDDPVTLRFKARSPNEAVVTFLCGGVADGKFPSSLRIPRKLENSPHKLSKEFKEYSISSLTAQQLTNLIDPFAVSVAALDNPGKKRINIQVTDIRYESTAGAVKPSSSLWRDRLANTCWIAYTPTGFNPTTQPVKTPMADEIRADLKALRQLLDQAGIEQRGLVLYGCRDGLEAIPALAADPEAGFAVILGIFLPRDDMEVANAEKLLKQETLHDTIVACCVGNESLTFRRAKIEEIIGVAERLRKARAVPMTTTEIVQEYGDARLVKSFDFVFFNAHGLFAGITAPGPGAKWACDRLRDLKSTVPADMPILVKEFGWPSGPAPLFDADQQREYWSAILAHPLARKVNIALFDGMENTPWKSEVISIAGGKKAEIGPHWAILLDAQRQPKPHALEILASWKKSREP